MNYNEAKIPHLVTCDKNNNQSTSDFRLKKSLENIDYGRWENWYGLKRVEYYVALFFIKNFSEKISLLL